MRSLLDLSDEVLDNVFLSLGQYEFVNLTLVCKEFYHIAIKYLYSRIYVSNESNCVPGNECSTLERPFSYVHSSLTVGNSGLKKLERSFIGNKSLALLVEHLATDDISFVLFKLKFWNRFFLGQGHLKLVFFGNVQMNQLNVAYDELFEFYKSNGASLTTLQIRNLKDLLNFCEFSHSNIKHITFYLVNIGDIDEDLSILPTQKLNLLDIFESLEVLEIYSVHNLSLRFLSFLLQLLGTDKPFLKNLNTLTLNHNHGQIGSESSFSSMYPLEKELELNYDIIRSAVNIESLRSLSLKVDCNHICSVHLTDVSDFSAINNSEFCGCLESFFEGLMSSDLKSLKELIIIRSGQSSIRNPYSLYYFKNNVAKLLSSMSNISRLKIDTNAQLYPFQVMNEKNSHMQRLGTIYLNQNSLLLRRINDLGPKRLEIADYLESFYVWDTANNSVDENVLQSCGCIKCANSMVSVTKFLQTNRDIQFYLNPVTTKTLMDFYYDLVHLILLFHKEFNMPALMQTKAFPQGRGKAGKDMFTHFVPILIPGVPSLRPRKLDLHECFKHSDYKDLIHYKYVKSLLTSSDKNFEIMCQCDGSEFTSFKSYLKHQIKNKADSVFESMKGLNGTTVNLNNIYWCVYNSVLH